MNIIKEKGTGGNIKKWYQFRVRNRAIDILVLIILGIFGYRGWFRPGILDIGDLLAYPREQLVHFFSFPYIWNSTVAIPGLGTSDTLLLHRYPLFWLYGLISRLGFDFSVSERIVYFFPYLFLSLLSMYYFTYVLFKKRLICFFASMFYVFNTFVLSLVAGGILSIAMAYALAPLVLAFFIKGLKENRLRNGLLAGMFLTLSICYEPRISYLTIGAISLFFVNALIEETKLHNFKPTKKIVEVIGYLMLVSVVPVVLHFYWILPSLLVQMPELPTGYDSEGWVRTLSYAKLSHNAAFYSISWPLGSPSFPVVPLQYFAIPLIVLIGVLSCLKDKNVRLLAIIALMSVFFGKGSNKPFGEVYIWFFKYFPGGKMFREPGKFLCLVALAYAPLLGVGIDFLSNGLRRVKFKKLKISLESQGLRVVFLAFIFFFLIYLIFPAMVGKVGGTFDANQVPREYEILEEFIKSQPLHFRTFWRPIKG